MRTRVINKTGLRIDFDVGDNGTCPLRGLPPGGSQSVSLSMVRKCCRERGSTNWPIRVLLNNCFYGMCLHPHDHILKMTRIVVRYKSRAVGSCSVPILEGVVETCFNRFFGCCINWKKRDYVQIAEANSSWPINIRSLGDPNNVVGLGPNNIRQTTPPLASGRISAGGSGGGRSTPEPDLNSGENSSRRLLYLRSRDILAFTLVVHLAISLYKVANLQLNVWGSLTTLFIKKNVLQHQ